MPLRVSQEQKDGPDEEEKAEKNQEGKNQQRKIFGMDQFTYHQSLLTETCSGAAKKEADGAAGLRRVEKAPPAIKGLLVI